MYQLLKSRRQLNRMRVIKFSFCASKPWFLMRFTLRLVRKQNLNIYKRHLFNVSQSTPSMNIHKGCETMHYLPWHKYSSLGSEVNYLSQLLHAKWCNSQERSRETTIFFFSISFHSIKHLLTRVHVFTPVGLALNFVFLQSYFTSCQDTVAKQWHMELQK